MPMVTEGEPMDGDTLEMIRLSFHHVKVNPNMPSNIQHTGGVQWKVPTLIFTGEKDALFPGKKVKERAEELMSDVRVEVMKDCGHLYFTSEKRKKEIKKIFDQFMVGADPE